MRRVTGIGGIFFRVRDRDAMGAWYQHHLGIPVEDWHGVQFHWREADDPGRRGTTVWSLFETDTDYFGPGPQPFMVNYRVEDLDALLEQLRAEGVSVEERREESEFGKFAWITDPEGNRIELWEPPAESKP